MQHSSSGFNNESTIQCPILDGFIPLNSDADSQLNNYEQLNTAAEQLSTSYIDNLPLGESSHIITANTDSYEGGTPIYYNWPLQQQVLTNFIPGANKNNEEWYNSWTFTEDVFDTTTF